MTGYDENKEFDRIVRSTLESGREEVPVGLWSGVERRLPAAATASRRPVFSRVLRASAATLAAASLAVGVVFTARQHNGAGSVDILNVGPALTEVPALSDTGIALAGNLPAMAERVPSSINAVPCALTAEAADKGEGKVSVEEIPSGFEEAPVTISTNEGTSAPEVSDDKPYENKTIQPLADDFPEEAAKSRSSRRPTVSLGAYTNAASNGTSTKAGAAMMKRPANLSAQTAPQTSVNETSTPVYGIPVSAGLAFKIGFTERWGLGLGVNYSFLSSRFDGVFMKEDGTSENYSNIRNEMHYIGIPVNVYCNIINSDIVNFYTFAGGTIEKGLSNKYRMVSPENGTQIHKEKIDGLQYSAGLGLGVEFNVARHFGIYIDPSIRYYFNTGQPRSIRTQQPFLAQIDLGFRVNF